VTGAGESLQTFVRGPSTLGRPRTKRSGWALQACSSALPRSLLTHDWEALGKKKPDAQRCGVIHERGGAIQGCRDKRQAVPLGDGAEGLSAAAQVRRWSVGCGGAEREPGCMTN